MKYYPVIVTTLNRYRHFSSCIKSLAACKYADQTELIIGLDYPSKEAHWEGYRMIRQYIEEITGFSKVTIFEREYNWGAIKNVCAIKDYALSKYDACIVTEDDNVFAPSFLEFMNTALNTFETDFKICTVCGYTPEEHYNRNVEYLLSLENSAWGMGIWKSKEREYSQLNLEYYSQILMSFKKSWKIFIKYPACLGMLIEMCKKQTNYGDTKRSCRSIIENTYQLKPAVSLVRNIGHDGSGLHCTGVIEKYGKQEILDRNEYVITKNSSHAYVTNLQQYFSSLSDIRIKAILSIAMNLFRYISYRFCR